MHTRHTRTLTCTHATHAHAHPHAHAHTHTHTHTHTQIPANPENTPPVHIRLSTYSSDRAPDRRTMHCSRVLMGIRSPVDRLEALGEGREQGTGWRGVWRWDGCGGRLHYRGVTTPPAIRSPAHTTLSPSLRTAQGAHCPHPRPTLNEGPTLNPHYPHPSPTLTQGNPAPTLPKETLAHTPQKTCLPLAYVSTVPCVM
jgi:hypothetical protein